MKWFAGMLLLAMSFGCFFAMSWIEHYVHGAWWKTGALMSCPFLFALCIAAAIAVVIPRGDTDER
ncbi:MAG TPA: hypothetical protein VFS24_06280 [Steroidobacteraceae bacterium]|nr:hypothetical protein [Steroidobacteraceae bacterium]